MIILRKLGCASTTQSVVVAGELTGSKDGTNKVFYTEYSYVSNRISIMYNGQSLHSPDDFLETDDKEITLKFIAPYAEEPLRATYETCEDVNKKILVGKKVISNGVDNESVIFTSPFDSNDYVLNVDLIHASVSTPSIYSYIIGDKSKDGFTVYFSGDIDSSNYVLEWAAQSM
jgi:hypothetical protein